MTIMPLKMYKEMNYRFTLLKGSRKNVCPSCQKKTLVNYFDNSLNEILPPEYGRCDREVNCSYHLNPYKNGYSTNLTEYNIGDLKNNYYSKNNNFLPQKTIQTSPYHFDFEVYKKALGNERINENTFFQNLTKLQNQSSCFKEELRKIVDIYKIGTIIRGSWKGAVTFPFIDLFGNIRTVQVKKFDDNNNTISTNKLDKIIVSQLKKEGRLIPEWLLKHVEYGDKYGYFTCLFGEHLLSLFPDNRVALVEAPKTAIYCSLYFGLPKKKDDFIFLAVFNKSSFSFDKTKVLEGRTVFVFPDLSKNGNTFKEWEEKAKKFEGQLKNTKFIFSDLLEKFASDDDRSNGLDVADYLIKLDWKKFRNDSQCKNSTLSKTENEKSIEELRVIAEKIIGKNNSLRFNEIPNAYQMIEKQIIKLCKINNAYYLTDSTPF
jgi:hypothetical protein